MLRVDVTWGRGGTCAPDRSQEWPLHNAYGARRLLQDYLGLKTARSLKIPEIVWQHGWNPPIWNGDVDQIVGESGETSYLPLLTYFVGRLDQEDALKQAGVPNTWAIGLPFAYALLLNTGKAQRIPNSVLIVPALHGYYWQGMDPHMDFDYLNFLSRELGEFGKKKVLMNCDDLELGRHLEWLENGYEIEKGGCESDDSSLARLVEIFESYEVMTTNDFGSPIAYAAAAGCRISVAGPQPAIILSKSNWTGTFYLNRADLALGADSWFPKTETYLGEFGLLCSPSRAIPAGAWGKREIGFDKIKKPEELKKMVAEAYRRHTSLMDRLGFKPIRKRIRSLQQLFAIAGLRSNLGTVPNLLFFVRNALNLLSRRVSPIRSLRMTDSGALVHFRPQSSDLDNIYQHFVERILDSVDLTQPSRILDIGSYAGYSILFFADKFPNAKITGIEADPENFNLCVKNLGNNPNVHLVNKAVWIENSTVSLLEGPEGAWSNKVIPQDDAFPTVEGITIKDLLEEVGWASADIIKVDIEGSEYAVLASVASEVSSWCSVLVVEFHHKLARRAEIEDLIAKMVTGTHSVVTEVGEFTIFDFRSRPGLEYETTKFGRT